MIRLVLKLLMTEKRRLDSFVEAKSTPWLIGISWVQWNVFAQGSAHTHRVPGMRLFLQLSEDSTNKTKSLFMKYCRKYLMRAIFHSPKWQRKENETTFAGKISISVKSRKLMETFYSSKPRQRRWRTIIKEKSQKFIFRLRSDIFLSCCARKKIFITSNNKLSITFRSVARRAVESGELHVLRDWKWAKGKAFKVFFVIHEWMKLSTCRRSRPLAGQRRQLREIL